MSLAVGAVSNSKNMGLDENKEGGGERSGVQDSGDESEGLKRSMSESSFYATEDEDEDEEGNNSKIQLGPQCTLKEQFEQDKVCSSPNSHTYSLLLQFCFFFFLYQYFRIRFYPILMIQSLYCKLHNLKLMININIYQDK